VTITFPAPAAWAGVIAVIDEVLTTVNVVASVPPKVTAVAPVIKFAPEIVTAVPPLIRPYAGVILLVVGAVV
jgi:hypothetical protein